MLPLVEYFRRYPEQVLPSPFPGAVQLTFICAPLLTRKLVIELGTHVSTIIAHVLAQLL